MSIPRSSVCKPRTQNANPNKNVQSTHWGLLRYDNNRLDDTYGPSPPSLNKNRVLTLKLAARCRSRVFRVQPCLSKGWDVGLIFGPSLLKYLLDLVTMIAKNVPPRHKQFRNFSNLLSMSCYLKPVVGAGLKTAKVFSYIAIPRPNN